MQPENDLKDRLKQVREALGYTQKRMGEAVGGKLRSWQDYESGRKAPGSQVIAGLVALGIDANWVLTGQGGIFLGRQGEFDVTQELNEIDQRLDDLGAPFDVQRIESDEVVISIFQRLKRISALPGVSENDKARADMMLRLGFGDQEAGRRFAERQKNASTRLKASIQELEQAIEATGYKPSELLEVAFRHLLFTEDLTVDGAVLIMEALKADR